MFEFVDLNIKDVFQIGEEKTVFFYKIHFFFALFLGGATTFCSLLVQWRKETMNYERKIDMILKMVSLYLNVKYIKTGSRILTYDTSLKYAGV